MIRVARFVWALTGIAWAAASLLVIAGAQYWEATSSTDFLAVWTYTAAWLLAAPTMLLITRGSPGATNILARIFAVAAIVVGTANALEDAVGLTELGTIYVISFVVALLTLVPLTATLWRAGSGRLAGVTAALLVGSAFVTTGGGMLVLAASVALVVAPVWFGVRLRGDRAVF